MIELKRGMEVTVTEANIRPWNGTVLTVKPSKSGQWVEVQREDDGVWSVPADKVAPR